MNYDVQGPPTNNDSSWLVQPSGTYDTPSGGNNWWSTYGNQVLTAGVGLANGLLSFGASIYNTNKGGTNTGNNGGGFNFSSLFGGNGNNNAPANNNGGNQQQQNSTNVLVWVVVAFFFLLLMVGAVLLFKGKKS